MKKIVLFIIVSFSFAIALTIVALNFCISNYAGLLLKENRPIEAIWIYELKAKLGDSTAKKIIIDIYAKGLTVDNLENTLRKHLSELPVEERKELIKMYAEDPRNDSLVPRRFFEKYPADIDAVVPQGKPAVGHLE